MSLVKISKGFVDSEKAEPGDRDRFLWDDEIKGFGLKVTPAGRKVYVFQYRIARPGEAARTPAKRYTIGTHGKLTPDQARTRAKELAGMTARGIDPRQIEIDEATAKAEAEWAAVEKARIESELLFETVAADWLRWRKTVRGTSRNFRKKRQIGCEATELIIRRSETPSSLVASSRRKPARSSDLSPNSKAEQ